MSRVATVRRPDARTGVVGTVPVGVRLASLAPHADDRGVFTELFREEWAVGTSPIQWNAVRSDAGVLRGVHVHLVHDDYLTVPLGRASIGLCDLRRDSPTWRASALVEVGGRLPRAITIPHGVAHGFYFHEPSLHVYAVSHYWDPRDELGCVWNDPALGIPWPVASARISDRDANLPPLDELLAEVPAAG
jgi:dTDP-4-dehydrorhamnose 3,5-epimerase